MLVGFLGQLSLQSQNQLGETPRGTLERLTGFHIGPIACEDTPYTPTMAPDMVMPHESAAPFKQGHPHRSGNDHRHVLCFLCPLLQLPAVILGVALFALLVVRLASTTRYVLPIPCASPDGHCVVLPPPTGPPAFV